MSRVKPFHTFFAAFLISITYKIGVQSLVPVTIAVQASGLIIRPMIYKWLESLWEEEEKTIDYTTIRKLDHLSDRLEKSTQETLNQMKKLHSKNRYDRNKEQLYCLMHSIQQEYMRAFNDVYNASLNFDESVIREYSESVKGFRGNILENELKEIAGSTNFYLSSYAKNIQVKRIHL